MSREKVIIIGGPTESGKTALSISIAKKFNGELINADSRQIYKYLNIGTNKGEIYEYNNISFIDNIPIHLVNFLNPDIRFSVFEYKKIAEKTIKEILDRGKLPIIVGGTGLYIDSIIKQYLLSSNNTDQSYRMYLESLSLHDLQEILQKIDLNSLINLNISDRSNPRRLIRVIEKIKNNSQINENHTQNNFEYDFFYPSFSWQELKVRIENRVEQMFNNGLVNETKEILKMGFPEDSVALQGIGYREVIKFLNNTLDLNTCIELVKISHKQYAKRQKTWFEGKKRNYNLIRINNSILDQFHL